MNKFAKLNTARQLTDNEMLELKGGGQGCDSCKPGCKDGCKRACKPGNMNTGTTIDLPDITIPKL
jgi:hypothetical protein